MVAPTTLERAEVDEQSRGVVRRAAAWFAQVGNTRQAGAKGGHDGDRLPLNAIMVGQKERGGGDSARCHVVGGEGGPDPTGGWHRPAKTHGSST
jgi:hypothetical protein